MEFEQTKPSRTAVEVVNVSIAIEGAEPRAHYGSKARWRPERISIVWRRTFDDAVGRWSKWTFGASVRGPWLRKDGSRANREPVSEMLYRGQYGATDADIALLEAAEKTRPTHEPPTLAPFAG